MVPTAVPIETPGPQRRLIDIAGAASRVMSSRINFTRDSHPIFRQIAMSLHDRLAASLWVGAQPRLSYINSYNELLGTSACCFPFAPNKLWSTTWLVQGSGEVGARQDVPENPGANAVEFEIRVPPTKPGRRARRPRGNTAPPRARRRRRHRHKPAPRRSGGPTPTRAPACPRPQLPRPISDPRR